MNKFVKLISWEARRILRFPLLEIFLVLIMLSVVTEMFYVSQRMSEGSAPLLLSTSRRIVYLYGKWIAYNVSHTMSNIFIVSILTGSTLIGNFMAKEIENGTTKLYASHPISRSHIFISKYIVCFFSLALVPLLALLISVFMIDPRFPLYLMQNEREIISLLIVVLLMSFYITSVSVACSVFSRNVAMSLFGSIGILLVINIVSGDYSYLPGRSLSSLYVLFCGNQSYSSQIERTIAIVFLPLVGANLSFISYYLFTRRMELS